MSVDSKSCCLLCTSDPITDMILSSCLFLPYTQTHTYTLHLPLIPSFLVLGIKPRAQHRLNMPITEVYHQSTFFFTFVF